MKDVLSVALLGAALYSFSLASHAVATHWGYTGHGAPEHWGTLDSAYQTCSVGKNQSPVNIASVVEGELAPLQLSYTTTGTAVVNNGHAVQVNIAAGSQLTLDGDVFALKQFHFHSPSENQIEGKSFPLEAHFVHADAQGNLAVVAVLFEEGASNDALNTVWQNMPMKGGEQVDVAISVADIQAILPKQLDYYRFSGSLTTPPCSEGVRWLVLAQPVTVSKAQIEHFMHAIHHGNNRPVQPLNGRLIVR